MDMHRLYIESLQTTTSHSRDSTAAWGRWRNNPWDSNVKASRDFYCGEGALAKKRVAMLRTEKTRAAFSALPSLGASSTALTFFPLIRPPRRAEMPAW